MDTARFGRLSIVWPFLLGGAVGFVMLPFGAKQEPSGHIEVIVAAILFAGITAAAFVDWERQRPMLGAVPLVASFAVIALLRDADGGPDSGYGLLVLLPVFWLALHGSQRQLLASLPLTAAVFVVPILIDSTKYPAAEWRRAALWLVVTAGVGITTGRLVERVGESARTDALTGLPNRRACEERLQLVMKLSLRTGRSLSVAMLDLDDFKLYNDRHGHLEGDRLLVRAASSWLRQLRAVDMLGRLGGDEFVLLLPHSSLENTLAVVARVQGATPDVRCSAGAAEWDHQEDADRLLARADAALYADKASHHAAR